MAWVAPDVIAIHVGAPFERWMMNHEVAESGKIYKGWICFQS
jgi:hypothetical protein